MGLDVEPRRFFLEFRRLIFRNYWLDIINRFYLTRFKRGFRYFTLLPFVW